MRKYFRLLIAGLIALWGCTAEELPHKDGGEVYHPDFFNFRVTVDGREYRPADTTKTGCLVFVPGGTDLRNLVPSFEGTGKTVTVNGVAQESGVTPNDFTSYKNGVTYRIRSEDGKTVTYNVKVIDTNLPVAIVTTDTPRAITSKTVWRDASLRIRGEDGRITDLGRMFIRGRGNWTWDKYPKKPYAVKLDKRQGVLGMPAHKRWVLLAEYRGFIGNPLMFEATRRASALGWAPRGQFVELVLNGKFQGMYYLCEQIKIDKNRVNIQELKAEDTAYPAVSGGYLLEYDELYDEEYKFKSSGFHLPVQIKAPNDTLPQAQFSYIRGFINEMEAEIKKIGTGEESHYADYLDVDSFADWWLVLETISNYEAYKPRSVKFYKGRDGVDSPPGTVCKLKAGPLWDQELFLVDKQFNSKDMYYFKYLFRDPAFVATVKQRWEVYKSNILGNDKYPGLVEYMNDMVSHISGSAKRDIELWDNKYFTLSGEVSTVRSGFRSKINWMDSQINAL
ncbi:MAG: CotH kinase family protein [Bacteroidales bacterium]|nr:CotH kinase family protein [Bacteroidales bacterium]